MVSDYALLMAENFDPQAEDPLAQFLRQTMGDEQADAVLEQLRAQGINPADLAGGMSLGNLKAAFSQFEAMMNRSTDPVNWSMASDIAKQGAYASQTREPTAAQASQARQAMQVADLWLDTVTAFEPGRVERKVWSRFSWLDNTVPTWKRITEPVVSNIVRALTSESNEMGLVVTIPGMTGDPQTLLSRLMALMFAHSIGQALAGLASESFGSTDVGLPLGPALTTALLPQNIEVFSEGLDIPVEEIVQFLAVRECAHHRLFTSVPWLTSDLIHAVESYSGEIALDLSAISEAARSMDFVQFDASQPFLSAELFSAEPTPRQAAALERLETLLALVEGWVEVVTRQATAPYLPHHEALTELIRRRRATGAPAEAVLGNLLGLKLRPRQSRGAAKLMMLVEADGGKVAREGIWRHPDFIPTAQDLSEPDSYLLLRDAAPESIDEFDADLEKLLDGTLGWAEGLEPSGPDNASSSEADSPTAQEPDQNGDASPTDEGPSPHI